MPDYLKHAAWNTPASSLAVRRRVSEMLGRIEREGEHAVRRYSVELDGWSPRSFVVTAAEAARAAEALEPELRRHIAFAQEQVRGFAHAQLATLTNWKWRRCRASRSGIGTSRSGRSARTCRAVATRCSRPRS